MLAFLLFAFQVFAFDPAILSEVGPELTLIVSVQDQKLYVYENHQELISYSVSTSKFGVGSVIKSNKTPLGRHRIFEKVGDGEPRGMIFDSREPTGQIARITHDKTLKPSDLVTSRLLWLEGLEDGINRGPGVDSRDRYIYIHGTADEGLIGQPASYGCIRMTNSSIIELFEEVREGTPVFITEL